VPVAESTVRALPTLLSFPERQGQGPNPHPEGQQTGRQPVYACAATNVLWVCRWRSEGVRTSPTVGAGYQPPGENSTFRAAATINKPGTPMALLV
jgi:hypothetical protein